MPIPIRCAGCGAEYNVNDDLAGQQRACPACGAVLTILAFGSAPQSAPPPTWTGAGAPPPPAPPYGLQPSWPDPRAALHIKLAGIFNVIAGGLSCLWSLLWLCYAVFPGIIVAIMTQAVDANRNSAGLPPGFAAGFPVALIGTIFGVLCVLSAGTGALQIVAGVKLLKRRPGARAWGLAAGVVSCICLWNYCCVWPLCLAAGIYTLVAMARDDVKYTLQPPAA